MHPRLGEWHGDRFMDARDRGDREAAGDGDSTKGNRDDRQGKTEPGDLPEMHDRDRRDDEPDRDRRDEQAAKGTDDHVEDRRGILLIAAIPPLVQGARRPPKREHRRKGQLEPRIDDRQGIDREQHHGDRPEQRHRLISPTAGLGGRSGHGHESRPHDARLVVDHREVRGRDRGGDDGGESPRPAERTHDDHGPHAEHRKVESGDRHEMGKSTACEVITGLGIVAGPASEQHGHRQRRTGIRWTRRRCRRHPIQKSLDASTQDLAGRRDLRGKRVRLPLDDVQRAGLRREGRGHRFLATARRPRTLGSWSRMRIATRPCRKQPTAGFDAITDLRLELPREIPDRRDRHSDPPANPPRSVTIGVDHRFVDLKTYSALPTKFPSEPVRSGGRGASRRRNPSDHRSRQALLGHHEIAA